MEQDHEHMWGMEKSASVCVCVCVCVCNKVKGKKLLNYSGPWATVRLNGFSPCFLSLSLSSSGSYSTPLIPHAQT